MSRIKGKGQATARARGGGESEGNVPEPAPVVPAKRRNRRALPGASARSALAKPPSRDAAGLFRAIWDAVPREEWIELLASEPRDSAAGKFGALLADPGFVGTSPERLLAEAELPFREFVELFRERRFGEAVIRAAEKHTERFVDDLGMDSRTTVLPCRVCLKTGRVNIPLGEEPDAETVEMECPNCGGDGTVRRPGDSESRKLFAKIIGADKPVEPAPAVVQQFNLGSSTHHSERVARGQMLLEQGRKKREQGRVTVVSVTPSDPDAAEGSE